MRLYLARTQRRIPGKMKAGSGSKEWTEFIGLGNKEHSKQREQQACGQEHKVRVRKEAEAQVLGTRQD